MYILKKIEIIIILSFVFVLLLCFKKDQNMSSGRKSYAQILRESARSEFVLNEFALKELALNESTTANDLVKSKKSDEQKKQIPLTYGCIFKSDEIYYRYMGTYKEYTDHKNIKTGDNIKIGMNIFKYDQSLENFWRVRAVYKYKNRFYFIPGSFSFPGSMRPRTEFTVVQVGKELPKELNPMICHKVCPGYMDY